MSKQLDKQPGRWVSPSRAEQAEKRVCSVLKAANRIEYIKAKSISVERNQSYLMWVQNLFLRAYSEDAKVSTVLQGIFSIWKQNKWKRESLWATKDIEDCLLKVIPDVVNTSKYQGLVAQAQRKRKSMMEPAPAPMQTIDRAAFKALYQKALNEKK